MQSIEITRSIGGNQAKIEGGRAFGLQNSGHRGKTCYYQIYTGLFSVPAPPLGTSANGGVFCADTSSASEIQIRRPHFPFIITHKAATGGRALRWDNVLRSGVRDHRSRLYNWSVTRCGCFGARPPVYCRPSRFTARTVRVRSSISSGKWPLNQGLAR